VLLSLYNYAGEVGRALRSVAIGTVDDVEVIVVDDGSRDGSPEAVARACEDLPWLPVKLLVRGRNAGLAAARTLAAEHARSPYLFVLDADNEVLPHGIERLLTALEGDPGAAFAYGILQCVTGGRPDDVMSWLGWEPERLRHGNFIDALALLRRDALLDAGGYPTDPRLYGWEDFALWCELAARGHTGVQVVEIVARYYAAAHSMISITNIDSAEAWAVLTRRHPFLDGAPL
jgi:glycosyltransferase involved in cell wall biosynthesis